MDAAPESDGFVVSSWAFARLLGVVLVVAFVSIGVQSAGLFGAEGISPIADFVGSAKRARHSFFAHPSLFWFGASDGAITGVWVLGTLSGLALAVGLVPRLAALVSWLAYLSFVAVGWPFMSFQWDTLLLEVTFASVFFVPWRLWDRFGTHRSPNPIARWALWFVLMRLMFRSAWVKLASGDPTWHDLTALEYHYFTQPLPTVLAWYADQLPAWFQKVSCLGMFAVEFGAPLGILVPWSPARRGAALSVLGLMGLIALTGNYGFFNLLTAVLAVAVLDDRCFRRVLSDETRERLAKSTEPSWRTHGSIGPAAIIAVAAMVFLGGTFGVRGASRLLSPLYAFATFNNYGLFSVMTTTRPEIVLEGTHDGETWTPYEFRYKPGPVDRRPVWLAPHQPRLDWQMWFAALGDFRRNPWLARFMRGLLENEPAMVELLRTNPFADDPPAQVRALVYDYTFTTPEARAETGAWWSRGEALLYAPVLGEPPREAAPPSTEP